MVHVRRFLGGYAPHVTQPTTSSNEHDSWRIFGFGGSSESEGANFDQASANAGGAEALEFYSDDLLQHVPIERQIRHQPLQLRVLIAHLSQLSQLAQTHTGVLPLPDVTHLLADPQLPADLCDLLSAFGWPECLQNLLFCVALPRYPPLLS